MDEYHKHNVEQKKPETKEYILYNPIYIKFKNYRTNLVLKVRVVNLKGSKKSVKKKSTMLGYWSTSNILLLDFGDGNRSVFICSLSFYILHLCNT